MNRRKFMQSAFVGGIISAIGTKSIGETIVEEEKRHDRRGNLTYWKSNDGNEIRMEYGNNNNLIYMRINEKIVIPDYIAEEKYDNNGNYIYRKLSNGQEFWLKYNKDNKMVYYVAEDGYEAFLKYDENDMLIDFRNYK